ncbi:hypothetical protein CDD80_111 [Ophiocordyceps camponoti-rufipedis]|uniref:Sodium/calcium exchanger membrane region domain-containing protein n=1 Tax=Ophiocordyceps camponoti-rufipedis TaxID=2004952 RepID=A0A2C5YLW8_9HYPO|nr:hypothetical protein CDD80_111 [Ophiocordyceps camponoti-rufipedis]
MVATYSWLNVLLVFVPIGIAVANVKGIHGGIVFAMNAIAIVPLAGLLSFATESVAVNMGDSLGALLNVTFGNAVELIILIALVKDQIRIVQASLLGSILANLLLILGMGFFLGGLRYREQVYNSTVTQVSACLLSLSVISLMLPTAFHASFNDRRRADEESLKISRGTSVILLLVYVIYLLFQLKSHAYMYESTPQHIVDAEAIPGPAAAWLDTSSSDNCSSASDDSDDSDRSRDTMRRKMKKVLRGGRRRKSSTASTDTGDTSAIRNGSLGIVNGSAIDEMTSEVSLKRPVPISREASDETEEVVEDDKPRKRKRHHRLPHRHHRRRHGKHRHDELDPLETDTARTGAATSAGEPHRVDFALRTGAGRGIIAPGSAAPTAAAAAAVTTNAATENPSQAPKSRPFPAFRGVSVKSLTPTVFAQRPEMVVATPQSRPGPVPRVRYGIRRTNSLPDRLRNQFQGRPPGAMFPARPSLTGTSISAGVGPGPHGDGEDEESPPHLSRSAAVILLLMTTGLVAVCAEFLVGSIEAVTRTSTIGEIFIGLIILPIVGNAAEHVTAITVAMKNKMDLAIGVAVGSSIQIALFVTPLVVILGWIIGREMSLFFTLFETVSLFASAFIVNFLVLDGRSNYLEGALLCAVYVIIAIVAFFFPSERETSTWGS